MKHSILILLAAAALFAMPLAAQDAGDNCVKCHKGVTPVLVQQWADSKHAGVGVTCLTCHEADPSEPDAFDHMGSTIATIVTPTDCAMCHTQEVEEHQQSYHAKAGDILGSLDNVLGEIVEGVPAASQGCKQCHGSTVALLKDENGNVKTNKLGVPQYDPATWPNTGMGRINLDGSKGSCSACHSRHAFSSKVARRPENCGKCHMGPDHPQLEIFNESKHGIAFHANVDQMNLDSDSWILGVDYSAAPTCATCHMSATKDQPITHDIGERISWTLRPKVSHKLDNWEEKRASMQEVCKNCHAQSFVGSFYDQYDDAIELYNEKFAKPAVAIMDMLKKNGKITPDPFDDKIEWTFFYLWHHEGRRARMGVSMMGPDYTQWHGFFEIAERFYFELLPEARELAHGDEALLGEINALLDTPDHAWLKGMSPEVKAQMREFYDNRYGGKDVH